MQVKRSFTPTWGVHIQFLLTGLALTLFMRYVWRFSLANGDEFFFAGLKNTAQIGNYSTSSLSGFLHFLWFEHTGRTADFLSTFVYYFGFSVGKWIVSALTGFSVSLIALSLYRSWLVFSSAPKLPTRFSWVALTVSLFALFSPAALNTAYISNLLVYSAAICNYLVFIALLTYAWSLSLTAASFKSWITPAGLVFIVGTAHEQAALAVLTLVFLTFIFRFPSGSKLGLGVFTGAGLAGSALMLASPGLSNKLRRASVALNHTQGFVSKATNSLYALAAQYHLLPVFILAVGIVGLLLISKQHMTLSFKSPSPFYAASSFAFLAVATLSIPLASGVGQVRVFHYPLILGALAAGYAYYLGAVGLPGSRGSSLSTRIIILIFLGLTLFGAFRTYDSQVRNFPLGEVQLINQINSCPNKDCMLLDLTGLPVHHGFSGYGEHDYAHTGYMAQWLESK